VRSGESTFVQSGKRHRLENPGKVVLEVIEVQLGEYLAEDDIVRFEDDFGRQRGGERKAPAQNFAQVFSCDRFVKNRTRFDCFWMFRTYASDFSFDSSDHGQHPPDCRAIASISSSLTNFG